jgi:hypothetical protein
MERTPLPEIKEPVDEKPISITMQKSEAIVLAALLTGALEQLAPLIPIDADVAVLCGKASNALMSIKAAIDA